MPSRGIITQGVAADVPPSWTEQIRDDGVEYAALDQTEQVIISVLLFKEPQAPPQAKQAVSAQIAARQSSLAKLSNGRAQLLPVKYEESPTEGVTLVGADVAGGVLICTRIIADSARLATISYYRYRDSHDFAGFLKAAEPVCQSLRVLDQ